MFILKIVTSEPQDHQWKRMCYITNSQIIDMIDCFIKKKHWLI